MQISSLKVELAEKRPELNFGAQVKMFPHSILILIIIYIYNRLPIIIVGFMRGFFLEWVGQGVSGLSKVESILSQ